jgi:hypothetical protein
LGAIGKAIAAAWSPLALWPDGASSPGMWSDGPSYPASCFQDSTGTTPISTVGTVLDSSNPVGLVLDCKGGLVLGAELVANGDFSNGSTGWTEVGTGWSISGGAASAVNVTGFAAIGQTTPATVAGKFYQCRITVSGYTSGQVHIYAGSAGYSPAMSANGSYSFIIQASGTAGVWVRGDGNFTGTVDNISVREIPGLHLSQSTSAARPVASGRKNLLVGTATLSTQSVTVTAIPHTITFSGGGTVTASGTYSGALTSGQTFTPTAGTLTLTVSGSVTSAQLERGSAATTYQAVVSASNYTATGFPAYLKFDGTDDALASATFAAGTLTSSMDCLIAVRRDSAANAVCGLYESVSDANKVFGIAESGSSSGCVGSGAGTPTVWVDGTQLTGGTAVTRGTLHTALTAGAWHILELRGLDLSTWTAAGFGKYTSYILNGGLGDIQLFASGQDANRDKARAQMAAYFGVTLP